MSQHDFNIANQGFPATRADINNAFQAIASNSSGPTAPSTTYANQWWYDTTNNKMYLRNEADSAWIEVATIDQTNNEWQITTGVVKAKDSDGLALQTDDGTTRLFIKDADGDIGIGHSSPTYPLHLKTADANMAYFESSDATSSNLFITNSNATVGNTANLFLAPANNVSGARIAAVAREDFSVSANRTADLVFYTRNNDSFQEEVRILAEGGITFNGDTATANALDDYEEGTWEPTLKGASSDPTVTYSADTGGYYIKVGRIVYLTGTLRWTAKSGGGGTALIGGLPYPVSSRSNGDNADGAGACRVLLWNGTSTLVPTIVHMAHSNSYLTIMSARHDNNTTSVQVGDCGSTGYIAFNITIYTN